MKKKIFAASLFAIAILVGAALTLSTFLQNLRPQIEGDFMSPIEKPATDFVDANFAWNVYRPVWEKFGFGETDDGRFEEIFVNVEEPDGQVVDTRSVNPNDDWLWTQAVEKLRRSEELLEGLRHGGSKVYWRVPYAWNENVAEKSLRDKIVLTKHLFWWHPQNALRQEVYGQLGNSVLGYTDPQLQKLVLAARLLIVDTRWAVEQGDVSRIVENVRTIFCFSNQASRSYSAAGNWIYLRIKTLGNDLLKEIICRHRELLTLSDVEDLLEMHRTNFPMQYVDLDWFRKGLLDLLQRMYSGEGVGTGVLTAQGFNILKCDYENSFHEYPVKSTWVFHAPNFVNSLLLTTFPGRKQVWRAIEKILGEIESTFNEPWQKNIQGKIIGDLESLREWNRIVGKEIDALLELRRFYWHMALQDRAIAYSLCVIRFQKKFGSFPASADVLREELQYVDDSEQPLDRRISFYYMTDFEDFMVSVYDPEAPSDGAHQITTSSNFSVK